jgi:DNA-binding PadR family transcriptional regulator
MELTATGKVILGMLRMRPRSGYEIKGFVDDSTRFFWSAGYGSIYPELKRLREAGLITGSEDPTGDRRRVVYKLTASGERALDEWLAADDGPIELRDEPLLRAFFSTAPEQASAALESKAAAHAEIAEQLSAIEPKAAALDSPFPLLALRYGVALHEFSRRWCEQQAARLADPEVTESEEPR